METGRKIGKSKSIFDSNGNGFMLASLVLPFLGKNIILNDHSRKISKK
jgi:hypothetical protein